MKNTLRLLIWTFMGCCFISNQSIAQSSNYNLRPAFFPPSPNAVGLGRYGEVEVGIHSGTPSIAIPLATLSGRQLSVPIGLSYFATGVRPFEASSWVGLNWSLLAGGVITRSVVGISDEASQGLYTRIVNNSPNGNPVTDLLGTLSYQQDLDEGVVDGMPDNFVYNFLGISGQLGYNDYGEFYAFRDQNMKIVAHPLDGGDEIWELVDGNGIRYIFGGTGAGNQQGVGHSSISNAGHFEYVETDFVSSWYLTKIVSADGTDEITFEYLNQTEYLYLTIPYWVDSSPFNWYPFEEYFHPGGGECHQDNNIWVPPSGSMTVTITGYTQLTRINSSRGSVDFTKLGNELKTITMKDTDGVTLGAFDFDYETAGSSVLLTEVTEKSAIGDVKNPYAFEYYSGTPSASNFTKWGFSGNAPTARTLNKIIYPEGKVTTLFFEEHSIYPYSPGGLRIREIRTFDPVEPDSMQITQYEYDQPVLIYDPAVTDIFDIEFGSCNIKILPIQTSSLLSRAGSPVLYKEVSILHGNQGKTVYKYDEYLDEGLPDEVIQYRAEGSYPTFKKVSQVFNTYVKDLDFREYVTTLNTHRRIFDVTPVVSGHYYDRVGSRDVSERIYLSKAITRTFDLNDETRYRDETEEYFYDSDQHIQLTRLKRTDSEGVVYETKYTYPLDYTISPTTTIEWEKAVLTMQEKNMVTPIITQRTLRNNQVTGAAKTDFKWWNSSQSNANLKQVYPEIQYSTALTTPIAESTFNSGNYYEVDARVLSYDNYGHRVESAKEGDYTSTLVYGHDHSLPIAQVLNANSNEVFYTSFEESGQEVFDSDARTGRFTKSLSGAYSVPQPSGNFPSGDYQLTYWWKSSISGSWSLQKQTYNDYTSGSSVITSKSSGYIDEVRFVPQDAFVSTSNYDGRGSLISRTNANNITSYYEYDAFGRLVTVRDQDQYILRHIGYQLQGEQEAPPTINLNKTSISVPHSPAGSSTVNVSSNINWTVTDNASWTTPSTSSGSGNEVLTINYGQNTGGSRTSTVTVSNGGISASVDIIQEAAPVSLSVTPYIWYPYPGVPPQPVTVTSNVSWTVSIDYWDSIGWLSVSSYSGSGNGSFNIYFNYSPGSNTPYEADVTVTGGGLSKTVHIIHY